MLSDLISGLRKKRERFKEVEEDNKISRVIEEKKKSSNERELERFLEEARQKRITQQLKQFRTRRDLENRKTTVFNGKNMFKGQKTMLQQKNIFKDNRQLFSTQGGMFFK